MIFHAWANKSGYDEALTIDRIDNDKGYSPDNCRWVTQKENAQNRRRSYVYNIKGKRYASAADAASEIGVSAVTVAKRCDDPMHEDYSRARKYEDAPAVQNNA